MVKVVVMTAHGQGNTQKGYANGFISRIKRKLPPDLWIDVHFEEIYYQRSLQRNQHYYFQKVKKQLQYDRIRQELLFGFSDAASLFSQPEGDESPYYLAQFDIRSAFQNCYRALRGEDGARVIIIATSLGGQVLSNYLWDACKVDTQADFYPASGIWQKDAIGFTEDEQEVAFCRGKGIHTFYTTGCNIPLFVSGMHHDNIRTFQSLPTKVLDPEFRWINYYDDDDVLGWPLQPLSDDYNHHVIDREIRIGHDPLLTHLGYWSSSTFIKEVVHTIRSIASG